MKGSDLLEVCVCAGHQCCRKGLEISSWACVPQGTIAAEWSRCLPAHTRTHTHIHTHMQRELSLTLSSVFILVHRQPSSLAHPEGAFMCEFYHKLLYFWLIPTGAFQLLRWDIKLPADNRPLQQHKRPRPGKGHLSISRYFGLEGMTCNFTSTMRVASRVVSEHGVCTAVM